MGGYGSGRRTHKKDIAEGYLCLDINTFRRRGQWKFMTGVSTWWRGEVKRAALSYILGKDGMLLYWQNRSGESVQQQVPVTSVGVNFGSRHYFLCPACQRRVTKLYAGSKF